MRARQRIQHQTQVDFHVGRLSGYDILLANAISVNAASSTSRYSIIVVPWKQFVPFVLLP
jgi:hypothetical protein